MGFRFRRSFKLLPGVRVNLSKTGVSTTIGRLGATANLSDRGTRTTVGLPGTGLSYSTTDRRQARPGLVLLLLVVVAVGVAVVVFG